MREVVSVISEVLTSLSGFIAFINVSINMILKR